MKSKVFIYPGDSYHAAIEMFERRGFEVAKDYEKVDLVCFLGGTDVDPLIYGAEREPYTQAPDRARDVIEVAGYHKFESLGVPMVGICRGGQLLNVLNGGEMLQDHGLVSGDVNAIFWDSYPEGYMMEVRVDHHQGMYAGTNMWINLLKDHVLHDPTVYAGYYPETKSLCFQPHPEWGHQGTEDYFFELIEEHLGLKGTL